MNDIAQGFRIGGRLFAWGARPGDVARVLGVPWDEGPGAGWRRLEIACGPSWGLKTISVEMTARARDRPVTALRYEVAAHGKEERPDPALFMQPLAHAFGPPPDVQETDVSAHGKPSDGVRFRAGWQTGDHAASLSLYGARRATAYGLAAGSLWLNWAVAPAARPFLDAWRRGAAALVAEAESHSGVVTFTLSLEPNPAQDEARGGATPARDSAYALGSPHLLPTPAAIADLLGARGIGLWRSGDHRRWYASTRWDTIGFEIGAPVEIDWFDITPAKGGGYSGISVDGWSAYDLHDSRAIREAVAALKTIPGVRIEHVDGYDS